MDIMNKEYIKFVVPQFFNLFRGFVYLVAGFLVLGLVSRLVENASMIAHFSIVMIMVVIIVIYDVIIGMKKKKTYASHKVMFMGDNLFYIDHRGNFNIPYERIGSYQLSGNTIVIRVKSLRFVIDGSKFGISQDEIRSMVELLASKEVPAFRNTYTFVLFFLIFIVINFGLDYLFSKILHFSEEISVFTTLYVCFVGGVALVVNELIRINQIKGM